MSDEAIESHVPLLRALLRIQELSSADAVTTREKIVHPSSLEADLLDQMDAIYGIARNTIRDFPLEEADKNPPTPHGE